MSDSTDPIHFPRARPLGSMVPTTAVVFRWGRVVFLTAVLSVVGWSTANGDELTPETAARIDRLVEKLVAEKGVPGISVAVGVNNHLAYAKGFGLSDVESQTPANEETKYRTASIAKSMTATVILALVEDGKIDLDTEVQEYCPEYPAKRWTLTSRQLLGHLGGVRHYKSAGEALSTRHFYSLREALETFKDDPLLYEPGSKYRYTTFGYNLLGSVAEGAAGTDFDSLLQEKVFAPAGMEQTVVDDPFVLIPRRTRGYIRPSVARLNSLPAEHRLRPGELYNAPMHDTSMKIPGGGLLSTSPDLVRFAIALNTGKLLSSETLQAMWSRQQTSDGQATDYGLGWRIGKQAGEPAVWHTGGQSGTSTALLLIPDKGISVALMGNLQNTNLVGLASAIIQVVMDEGERKAAAGGMRLADYQPVIEKLESVVKYEVEQKGLPAFSISIVDGSLPVGQQVVWADGFGFQDAEKKVRASADTVYRVGSVSKLFTDITLMQLVESGQLDLDAPIQEYLPEFKPGNPYGIPLTLRQMMAHRSGLVRESPVGNYFDPDEPTLAETVASLNSTALVYRPETKTKYSNAAVAVVGAVLEEHFDISHAARVQKTVLDPLGMGSSSFEMTPRVEKQLATAWMWTYDGRRFEAPRFLLGTGPAGNLYSSVVDLSKFLTFMFDEGRSPRGPIIKPETYRLMTTPIKDAEGKPLGFGVGFHIQELDGYKKIGHGGAVYGFSTQVEALPERKLGVAAVAALDGSNGVVRRLTDYALRLMIAHQDGKPLPDYRRTSPIAVDRIRALAGAYRQVEKDQKSGQKTGEVEVVQITELNGKAFLQRGGFRYELRSAVDDGTIVTDDVLGFGVELKPGGSDRVEIADKSYRRLADSPPAKIPTRWKGLIGEYGWDHNTLYILEDQGQLVALIEWFYYYPLKEIGENEFAFPGSGLYHGERLIFKRDSSGIATEVVAAEVKFERREVGTKDGETFKIEPVRPIDELRKIALASSPPPEPGKYREADLVDLTALDPTIKLDIRYASTNNFTGAVFYKQSRALMQRPAAEAVVRANRRLKERGLGLLVHDAYRPWHVTKMFWDATPSEFKDFVANPANGSRHNRGCAVDITLYDLKTGKPIQMVAGYDEFSQRSFPMYPGGTERQRWYRELLRRTMELEGFAVYEFEWWHFDFQDWKKYRIGNVTFEEIPNER